MKKNKDHDWGESPEDALPFVIAFIIVILLCTRCCGMWDRTPQDEPDVTATTTITEEVSTDADT